ncbi:MAG: sigma-70 family RNA polymerase sigma factor [Planctomycetes bacterium]|nr:sigma-70 family RNA polymerase sigma factor [Planctomycetota bacterium]
MSSNSAAIGLRWDLAAVSSVEKSQQWVLSAMQKRGPALISMLWRILGNEQDVCDAYQQTFLQLAHYQDMKKPANLEAYLFRTASNTAISMLRDKRLRDRSAAKLASSATETTYPDFAGDLDAKHLQAKLRAAISELPDYLKDVVVLRDMAEMPYAQIGKILSIPAATARVYRCKAINLLARWMK